MEQIETIRKQLLNCSNSEDSIRDMSLVTLDKENSKFLLTYITEMEAQNKNLKETNTQLEFQLRQIIIS